MHLVMYVYYADVYMYFYTYCVQMYMYVPLQIRDNEEVPVSRVLPDSLKLLRPPIQHRNGPEICRLLKDVKYIGGVLQLFAAKYATYRYKHIHVLKMTNLCQCNSSRQHPSQQMHSYVCTAMAAHQRQ